MQKRHLKSHYLPADGFYKAAIRSCLLIKKYPENYGLQVMCKRISTGMLRGNIRTANLNEFERFLRLLAARTGRELNYSTLSREIGVTVPAIKLWVSFLEASSIIYLLYP